MDDLYAVLGVSKTATADEIKKAYRDAAFRYHPDRNGGDAAAEEKFKQINAAYAVWVMPQNEGNTISMAPLVNRLVQTSSTGNGIKAQRAMILSGRCSETVALIISRLTRDNTPTLGQTSKNGNHLVERLFPLYWEVQLLVS